jgi:dihydroorotate dehydrogenase electron transfer subunit
MMKDEKGYPSRVSKGQYRATVAANVALCREHYRLELGLTDFPGTEPGQFVQIGCRELDEAPGAEDKSREFLTGGNGDNGVIQDSSSVTSVSSCSKTSSLFPEWHPTDPDLAASRAVLRRPFSLAGRRDEGGGVILEFIHRVVGLGTHWLSELKLGDGVHILGPLGNRFALPERDELSILVGGGVGIPPLLYLAERLAGRTAVALCGVTSRDLLPLTLTAEPSANEPTMCAREFARHGVPLLVSTDDGSMGSGGFVTAALEKYLDQLPGGSSAIVYTCGPELMMKAVAAIAGRRGLRCEVAVERAMACGMGTCQSCVIRVKTPMRNGREWAYRLACTDGPVFHGQDLLW